MTVKELLNELDGICPFSLCEDYDNSGLLLGSESNSANRILICLDVTPAVVKEAVEEKCDVILSHHPMIFDGLKRIDCEYANMISLCENNKISVIACHTNADLAGMGFAFMEQLHLTELTKEGYYMRGSLKNEVTFQELCESVRSLFQPSGIRSVGDLNDFVQTIAFVGGAGGREDFTSQARADVMITSEVKYNLAIKAKQTGVKLIEMGHGESELSFCIWMQNKLSRGIIAKTRTIPYN